MRSKRKIQSLKEPIDQKWIYYSYGGSDRDQYGFEITGGDGHTLSFRGQNIYTFHSMEAARLVSLVIINDIISKKKLPKI